MNIVAIESYYWGSEGGTELLYVWLIAGSTPSPMPTNTDSVSNIDNGKKFAPGSIMQIVGSGADNGDVYFYNEGWYLWG